MSVTSFPGSGKNQTPPAAETPQKNRLRSGDVVSLSDHRKELARKAREAMRQRIKAQLSAVPRDYVFTGMFFAGCLCVAHFYDKFTGAAPLAWFIGCVLALMVLAWVYHQLFLRTFFVLNGVILAVWVGAYFVPALLELAGVFVAVIVTNLIMQWLNWIE